MNKSNICIVLLISLLLAAGCGGGGGGGNVNSKGGSEPESSVTVIPSFSSLQNVNINVYGADGATLLGSGEPDLSGQVTITFNDYSGPIVIEVTGNSGAIYFDSAAGSLVDFPSGISIHAISPTNNGTFAVSVLTELAYQDAVANNDFPLDTETVTRINDFVRSRFVPDIGSLLSEPALFDSNTMSGSLGNDDSGKYALRLAALAQLGSTQAAPIFAVMLALIEDMKDGVIDRKNGTFNVETPYNNFWGQLTPQLIAIATNYGSTELIASIESFIPSATADTTAQNLTVGTGMPSFIPLLASGGTNPYTYSYTGVLPAGLGFSANTGTVTGAPNAIYATTNIIFMAKDVNNMVASTTSTVSFTVENSGTAVSAGSLDMTFNSTGIILTDFYMAADAAGAVTIQSDGKLVAAGTTYNPGTGGYDFALARYNADGSLDINFGIDGKVTTDIGTSLDTGRVMAIQPDGKIIVAGAYTTDNTGAPSGRAMARYNANGTQDTTFGTSGLITTTGSIYDFPSAIAIQSNGKIVVASTSYLGFALTRYSTDGSLDTTFGTSGRVYTAFTIVSGYDSLRDIVIQADGKIVAVGNSGPASDFALVRYNVNGSLDTTFGSDGKVTTNIAGRASASAVAMQDDGKIVVGGSALVRYNTDGSLDESFGTGGIVNSGNTSTVVIQGDGKIVTTGTLLTAASSGVFSLARFNSDGSLDVTFGTDGNITTNPGASPETLAYDAVIQTDGKIVVAGTSNGDFALVRYLP